MGGGGTYSIVGVCSHAIGVLAKAGYVKHAPKGRAQHLYEITEAGRVEFNEMIKRIEAKQEAS